MPLFKAFPREDKPDISIYGDGINTYKPAITLHSTRDVHTNVIFVCGFKLCMTIKSTGDLSQENCDEMECYK